MINKKRGLCLAITQPPCPRDGILHQIGSVQYSMPGIQSQYLMVAPSGRDVAPSGNLGPVYWATMSASSFISNDMVRLSIGMEIPICFDTISAISLWPIPLMISSSLFLSINWRISGTSLNLRNETIVSQFNILMLKEFVIIILPIMLLSPGLLYPSHPSMGGTFTGCADQIICNERLYKAFI